MPADAAIPTFFIFCWLLRDASLSRVIIVLIKKPRKGQRFCVRRRVTWPHDDRIGFALREIREAKRLPQNQLAARIGCARSHVCKVENGDQLLSVGEFLAWCDALEIDGPELLRSVRE